MAQSESETVLTEHHETDNLDPRTDAPARPGIPVHIAPVQLGNITVPLMLVVIGVGELTRQGQEIIAVNFRAFEVWLTVAIFYLAMTLSISAVLRYYERKLMIGRRAVPASPSDPQM